jgi:hypothetical protein
MNCTIGNLVNINLPIIILLILNEFAYGRNVIDWMSKSRLRII